MPTAILIIVGIHWQILSSCINTCLYLQYCLPHLRKVKGNIINDSSLVAKIAQRGAVPYVTSKGAIDAMTRAMAIDEAEHGVRVNGYVQQQLAQDMCFCFRDDSNFFQALRCVLVTDYGIGIVESRLQ